MALLDEILASPQFVPLPYDDKKKVLQAYYDTNIRSAPSFPSLSRSQQEIVHTKLMENLGADPNTGVFASALNGIARQIPLGADTRAAYWDLIGAFDRSNKLRKETEYASPAPGVSGFVGSAIGSVAPVAATLGLGAAGLISAPVSAAALAGIMGFYAFQNAGQARRLVYEYEKGTGDTVSPATEVAMSAGFGLMAGFTEWGGNILLKKAIERASPVLIERLGTSVMMNNIPEAVRIITRMAAIEGTQESAEQIGNNFVQYLSDVQQRTSNGQFEDIGLLQGVPQAFAGGVLGGGFAHGTAVKFSRFVKLRGRGVNIEHVEGDIPARLRKTPEEWQREQYLQNISAKAEEQLLSLRDDAVTEVENSREWQEIYKVIGGEDPSFFPTLAPLDLGVTQSLGRHLMGIQPSPDPLVMSELPDERMQVTPQVGVALEGAIKAAKYVDRAVGSKKHPRKARVALRTARAKLVESWIAANPWDVDGNGLRQFLNHAQENGTEVSEALWSHVKEFDAFTSDTGEEFPAEKLPEPEPKVGATPEASADVRTLDWLGYPPELIARFTTEERAVLARERTWFSYYNHGAIPEGVPDLRHILEGAPIPQGAEPIPLQEPTPVPQKKAPKPVKQGRHFGDAIVVDGREAEVIDHTHGEITVSFLDNGEQRTMPATTSELRNLNARIKRRLKKKAHTPLVDVEETVDLRDLLKRPEKNTKLVIGEKQVGGRRVRILAPNVTGEQYSKKLEYEADQEVDEEDIVKMPTSDEPTDAEIAIIDQEYGDVDPADAEAEALKETEEEKPAKTYDDDYEDDGGLIAEENLLFQASAKEATDTPIETLVRLVAPLQLNGIFTRVIQSGGQLYRPGTQQPVNAALDRASGVLYLSADVRLNTIGHEMFHRLSDVLGPDNAAVKAGLEYFDGDVEKAADAVGDYYALRGEKKSTTRRVGEWLRDMYAAMKVDLGLDLTQEEILRAVHVFSKNDVTGRGAQDHPIQQKLFYGDRTPFKPVPISSIDVAGGTNELELTRENVYSFQSEEEARWAANVRLDKLNMDEASEEIVRTHTEDRVHPQKTTLDQMTRRAQRLVTRLGTRGMTRLANNFRKTGRISRDEAMALRYYVASQLFDDALLMAQNPSSDLKEAIDLKLIEELDTISRVAVDSGQRVVGHRITVDPVRIKDLIDLIPEGLSPELQTELARLIDSGEIHDQRTFDVFMKKIPRKFSTKDHVKEVYGLLRAFWYSNVLSGVPTHLVNITSNTVFLGKLIAERATDAGVDAALSSKMLQSVFPTLRGRSRQIFLSETLPMWLGAKQEMTRLNTGAAQMLSGRDGPELKHLQEVYAEQSKIRSEMGHGFQAWKNSPYALARFLSPVVEFPTNALHAMDVYFASIAYSAQLNALAAREHARTGADIKGLLSDPPDDMREQSEAFALYATFNDDPGHIANSIIRLRDKYHLFPMIPFVRTVSNLLKRGLELTPAVGAAVGAQRVAEGKTVAAEVISKQLQGAILTALLYWRFSDEETGEWNITAGPPRGQAQRDAMRRQGIPPYALKINGTWVKYDRMEPFNIPVSIVANLIRGFSDLPSIEGHEDKLSDLFARASSLVIDSVINTSYLDNITGYMEEYGIKSYVERLPSTLVPYSSFWRSLYRAMDVVDDGSYAPMRESRGMFAQLANSLPFTSFLFDEDSRMRGEYRLDNFGEVIKVPGNAFEQWFPWKFQEETTDPVELELRRLVHAGVGGYPGLPSKTFEFGSRKVELDDEFYTEYSLAYGKATKSAIDRIMKKASYRRAKDEKKVQMLDRAISRARTPVRRKARRAYLRAHPSQR